MATPQADARKAVPLFAGLTGAERELLARNLDEVGAPAGATLIREGESNYSFFVLLEGEVEVRVGGEPRRTLGPGEFFGEVSMGHRVPATATVVARTPVRAYELSHAQFVALGTSPTVLARLREDTVARLLADRRAAAGPAVREQPRARRPRSVHPG